MGGLNNSQVALLLSLPFWITCEEKFRPKGLDHDVTSSFILQNGRKEEAPGSTFLPDQSVCAKSVCVGAHIALLRQSRAVIAFPIYGSRISPLYRRGLFPSPTNSGPEVSWLFVGGDQVLPAGRADRLTGIACSPEGHDAGQKRTVECYHPGN